MIDLVVIWNGSISHAGQQDTDLLLCAGIPTKRDAPDLHVDGPRRPPAGTRRPTMQESVSYAKVRAALERQDLTARELMTETHLKEPRVRAVICRLQRQRLIRAEWIPVQERTHPKIWTRYRWAPR